MTVVQRRRPTRSPWLVEFTPGFEEQYRSRLPASNDLWQLVAAVSFGFALLIASGAIDGFYNLHLTPYIALQMMLVSIALTLAPRGMLLSLRFALPTVLFFFWWLASYFWANFQAGWFNANLVEVATFLVIVVIGSMLPFSTVIRSIITVGYIAIVLSLVALVVQTGLAYAGGGEPIPGLRGSFQHKNQMVPILLLTMLAVLIFERRPRVRHVTTGVIVVMILLSRSSTGYITLALCCLVVFGLRSFERLDRRSVRGLGAVVFFATIIGGFLVVASSGPLADLIGKDSTFSGRQEVWGRSIDMIQTRPLTGFGSGSWGLVIGMDPGRYINSGLGYVVFHAHNGAIEMMLRLGIVGLALYFCQFFTTVRVGWRMLSSDGPVGRFILAVMIVIFVFALSEAALYLGMWLALTCLFGTRSVVDPRVRAATVIPHHRDTEDLAST